MATDSDYGHIARSHGNLAIDTARLESTNRFAEEVDRCIGILISHYVRKRISFSNDTR